jgi:SAM-dependent methyltransferase
VNELDYNTITEFPNTEVSILQLKRCFQRYMFARNHIVGGKVIEVGCGGGQGLNLLKDVSDELIGYDIDEQNVEKCKETYYHDNKIRISKEDIETIDFKQNSIQTVILFETIYYLNNHHKFFNNLYKALKLGGDIIICTANKNWHSFNPSPFSTKYFDAKELYELGNKYSFDVEMYVSFPDMPGGLLDKLKNSIKRFAIRFGLIPKTMNAKLLFKKIFSGEMVIMPEKFEKDTAEYIHPEKTDPYSVDIYSTAIFAIFTKR